MLRNGLTGKLLLQLILIAACLYGMTYCVLPTADDQGAGRASQGNSAGSLQTTGTAQGGGQQLEKKTERKKREKVEKKTERKKPKKDFHGPIRMHGPVSSGTAYGGNTAGEQSPGPPEMLEVDRQLAQLQSRLSFNTPEHMQMGESTRIVLVLGRTGTPQEKTPGELEGEVRQQGGKKGPITAVEDVPSTERMRARLTGTDFKIVARDSETQPLTTGQTTTWHWDVTPTRWGKKTLHLTVEALVTIRDEETPFTVHSYDRDITVNVTMPQRLVAYTRSIPGGIRDAVIVGILTVIGTALLGFWKGWWPRLWAKIRPTPRER